MKKYWKLALLATFLLVIIALNYTGMFSFINISLISNHHVFILDYIDNNFYKASLIYILIYIAAVLLSIPGAWLLTLTGGFAFGWQIGSFITVFAATIGACFIFIITKSILGDFFRKKIDNKKGMLKKLEQGIHNNAFSYLLFMRLMPIFPFVFVNIAPAIIGIRLNIYLVTTFIGIIPGTVVYSLIGAGASDAFIHGNIISPESYNSPEIIVGLSGLALLSLLPIFMKYLKVVRNK